jgi:hypothetical protein
MRATNNGQYMHMLVWWRPSKKDFLMFAGLTENCTHQQLQQLLWSPYCAAVEEGGIEGQRRVASFAIDCLLFAPMTSWLFFMV